MHALKKWCACQHACAQSVEHAIGQVEAVTFCLSQQPPVLPLNADLLALTTDALGLADKEEQVLAPRLMATASRGTTMESLTRLRVACMSLLCAALGWDQFRENLDASLVGVL